MMRHIFLFIYIIDKFIYIWIILSIEDFFKFFIKILSFLLKMFLSSIYYENWWGKPAKKHVLKNMLACKKDLIIVNDERNDLFDRTCWWYNIYLCTAVIYYNNVFHGVLPKYNYVLEVFTWKFLRLNHHVMKPPPPLLKTGGMCFQILFRRR